MSPAPIVLGAFIWSSVGTGLAVASANTFNQIIEIERDAIMSRTQKRILPTGKVSVRHAMAFGITTGLLGFGLLATQVNMLSAGLALANIILYALIYTPLKTKHPVNTLVGSIVGAVPPVIGWVAATGTSLILIYMVDILGRQYRRWCNGTRCCSFYLADSTLSFIVMEITARL